MKKQITNLVLVMLTGLVSVPLLMADTEGGDQAQQKATVREPVVAGQFYPSDKRKLRTGVHGFLEQVKPAGLKGDLRALIVPHAGYVYSGQVAAYGFKQIKQKYSRAFILASNHNAHSGPFRVSVAGVDFYKTPLGLVKVSSVAQELLADPLFTYVPAAHATHVIEVELPFLQTINPDIEIVPIVTGSLSEQDTKKVAALISRYLDNESLLVISSDLSHYHPYNDAVLLDKSCIKALAAKDSRLFSACEACGLPAAKILMQIATERGWQGAVLNYRNSGDVSGDKTRVVGYSSIAFYQEHLSVKDKAVLLDLARKVLNAHVAGEGIPKTCRN